MLRSRVYIYPVGQRFYFLKGFAVLAVLAGVDLG